MAGIQVTHVPYKGGAAALDLVAGRTKLHAEIAKAVRSREGREWLAASGAAPGGEPPEQFAAFIKAEYEKWGRLVREAGIKVE